jgi:hypothetical protein
MLVQRISIRAFSRTTTKRKFQGVKHHAGDIETR